MTRVHRNRHVANRILQALSDQAWQALSPHLEEVDLPYHEVLYHLGDRVHHVHFVETGFVSLVKTMSDGRSVEVGGIGVDGLVGVSALHGYNRSIFECVVQMGGTAYQVAVPVLHRTMEHSPTLRNMLMRYGYVIIQQVAQTAACNRLHHLPQRCCRWLLIAHDSVKSDQVPLTHEFLAVMLGVQRPGVSVALSSLEHAGLIRLNRGSLTIVDRKGLERSACECYRAIHDEIERVFKNTGDLAPGKPQRRSG